jgi:uncharacterized protein (TIGR02147 family)
MNKISQNQQERGDFRLFLQAELAQRCKRKTSYSLRAFARALETDVSSLSKMLSGQRPIGRLVVKRLGRRLGLPPHQIEFYASQAASETPHAASAPSSDSTGSYASLNLDVFEMISDWYHYAILELTRLDTFTPDPKWIARVLGISVHLVNGAVERLQRLELLEIDGDRWTDQSEDWKLTTVASDFTAPALRNLQRQILEKALEALEEIPMPLRDQSSMTMAIDSSKLTEAKAKIKKFRRELAQFLSRGEVRDQVYNLGISLYPLTQIKEKDGN